MYAQQTTSKFTVMDFIILLIHLKGKSITTQEVVKFVTPPKTSECVYAQQLRKPGHFSKFDAATKKFPTAYINVEIKVADEACSESLK